MFRLRCCLGRRRPDVSEIIGPEGCGYGYESKRVDQLEVRFGGVCVW